MPPDAPIDAVELPPTLLIPRFRELIAVRRSSPTLSVSNHRAIKTVCGNSTAMVSIRLNRPTIPSFRIDVQDVVEDTVVMDVLSSKGDHPERPMLISKVNTCRLEQSIGVRMPRSLNRNRSILRLESESSSPVAIRSLAGLDRISAVNHRTGFIVTGRPEPVRSRLVLNVVPEQELRLLRTERDSISPKSPIS